MPNCCVKGCGSRTYSKKGPLISLHQFPKKEILSKKWLEIIGVENLYSHQKNVRICSLHFEDSAFNRTLDVLRLRDDSIPSKRLIPQRISDNDDSDDSRSSPYAMAPDDTSEAVFNGSGRLLRSNLTEKSQDDITKNTPLTNENPDTDTSKVVSKDPLSLLRSNLTPRKIDNTTSSNATLVAEIQEQRLLIGRLRSSIKLLRKKVKLLHGGIRRRDRKIGSYSQIIKDLQNSEKTIILLECEGADNVLKKYIGNSL